MTILPSPTRQVPHVCDTPSSLICRNSDRLPPGPLDGTLWECPSCGRWWRYHYLDTCWDYYEWRPVRWYDIPARRRIAAHETAKMHNRVPNIVGDLHWWNCHPNPKRGQP